MTLIYIILTFHDFNLYNFDLWQMLVYEQSNKAFAIEKSDCLTRNTGAIHYKNTRATGVTQVNNIGVDKHKNTGGHSKH